MQTLVQFIADGTVFLVIILGVYALTTKIPNNHKYAAYCRILMAGLTAFLVAKLMAALYQPAGERPFEILGVEPGAAYLDNPGFPSDHALFVTAILLAVWFETKAKAIAIALLVLVVLVGVGRVAALVHTPLDVLGGIVAAMIGALWYLTIPSKSGTHPKSRKR